MKTEEKHLGLDDITVKSLGINKDNENIAIKIESDTMKPFLKEGSIVIIDKSKNTLSDGGVFLLVNEAGIFLRRIKLSPQRGVELICDNRLYPSEFCSTTDISVVGQMVGAIKKI